MSVNRKKEIVDAYKELQKLVSWAHTNAPSKEMKEAAQAVAHQISEEINYWQNWEKNK